MTISGATFDYLPHDVANFRSADKEACDARASDDFAVMGIGDERAVHNVGVLVGEFESVDFIARISASRVLRPRCGSNIADAHLKLAHSAIFW